MAALIPAIGTCVSRMTGGERRLAIARALLKRPKLLAFDKARAPSTRKPPNTSPPP